MSDRLHQLREQLAAIEHERWSDWQRWVHKTGAMLGRDVFPVDGLRPIPRGSLVLPPDVVERWERQINTPYDQLSEREKDSDRQQVDRYWPLIQSYLEEPVE